MDWVANALIHSNGEVHLAVVVPPLDMNPFHGTTCIQQKPQGTAIRVSLQGSSGGPIPDPATQPIASEAL
jgi:hypothetical protein